MAKSRICSIPDCGKPHKGYGYCQTHFLRWKKGKPLLEDIRPRGSHPDSPQSFFLNAVAYEGDECLHWPFATNGRGYGKLRSGGQTVNVHRAICEAAYGPPPTSKHEAAHSCGNGHRGCITKKHLRWASYAENRQDMVKHGRSLRGHRNPRAKVSPADVLAIRSLSGQVTCNELGLRYGLSASTVTHILAGRSWKWLK